ncbi:MAG: hypothetical protein ACRCZW_11680 [Lactobacillaceae bacterium]
MAKENYLIIANLYSQLSEEFLKLAQSENSGQIEFSSEITGQMNLSQELFMKLVMVYVEETKRKHDLNLKRKSGVLLAKKSTELYIEFLNNHLSDGYSVSESEENPTFLIIRNEKRDPVSILRFITDLGYQRGTEFGKIELKAISDLAKKLGIPQNKIFVVIVSMINSLSEPDVKNVLGDNKMTNKKLLTNPKKLRYYSTEYIKSFAKVINNPEDHIFVWSYDLHPNVIADDVYNNKRNIKDYNLNRIEDVVTPILTKVKL